MSWCDFTCIYRSYPIKYFSFVHCSILPTSFYHLIYVLPYSVSWYWHLLISYCTLSAMTKIKMLNHQSSKRCQVITWTTTDLRWMETRGPENKFGIFEEFELLLLCNTFCKTMQNSYRPCEIDTGVSRRDNAAFEIGPPWCEPEWFVGIN